MINVTKTFLPPQEEYQTILNNAWNNCWITNRGELVKELENKLLSFLRAKHILIMANGTLPIQIAIKALKLKGEIITTPFSYVATTSSIVWEGCVPVFVDIHPDYLTIDETKIEQAITSKTSAILATHVFGNPCDVETIEKIAKKHNLKVIYDAAHCFGVTYKNNSIFNYGDVSTCSFHATKLFHTGEGGAIFSNDINLMQDFFSYHNFGHKGKVDFQGLGTNAKMSELQAALGLAVLPYIDEIIASRKKAVAYYNKLLDNVALERLKIRDETLWNFSYYPIMLNTETQLLKVTEVLNKHNIYPRRYFYPSLDKLPYVKSRELTVANSISKRVLCLPLFYDIEDCTIETVVKAIIECVKK